MNEIVSKNSQIHNFAKIRSVGAELRHADRWTDRQTDGRGEANSLFSQVSECAKILLRYSKILGTLLVAQLVEALR
jgi:hypothetical protein